MFTWSDFIYGQNFIDIILRRRFLSMKIENEKIIEFVSEIIVKISIKLTESVYIYLIITIILYSIHIHMEMIAFPTKRP